IYKAGHPIYQTRWRALGRGMIELTLRQTQTDEPFLQPVKVEIRTKAGSRRVSITPRDKETSISVRSDNPEQIIVDPDDAILKEVVDRPGSRSVTFRSSELLNSPLLFTIH